jgi:hypothetical protein
LTEHYASEQHQKSLVKCTQQIHETRNSDYSKADTDMDEENPQLLVYYEELSMMVQNIEAQHDEVSQISNGMRQCCNRMLSLSREWTDMQTASSLQRAYIDGLSINQNVLTQDTTTLKQRIENEILKQQEIDGTMIWKITNVREKMYDAQSERQTSIYSSAFYSSISGYKLCVRLYLNGDGTARGSYLSIFLVILRGQYDTLLKWPFSYRVSFCLCDQRTIIETNGTAQPKHIIESFRPDTNSISFQQPRSSMNIASGIPKFYSLEKFNQPPETNLYVLNDTIFIKTLIDFAGVPKTILPFIFNLNIALPIHVQQKLIQEEIQRRQEQNTN